MPGGLDARIAATLPGGGSVQLLRAEADPAAGSEVVITVPGRGSWELLAFTLDLVTDITVANRQVGLGFGDQTREYAHLPSPGDQAASLTVAYTWVRGLGAVLGSIASGKVALPLPELILPPGYQVATETVALQAGDNYGRPTLFLREHPDRGTELDADRITAALDRLTDALGAQ